MDKNEKLLNMLMDFNENIRFAAVCNQEGEILWHSQRKEIKNIIPLEETKKTVNRVLANLQENKKLKGSLGDTLYSISSYEKIKRITVPLGNGNIVFISVNNEPLKNSKNKSYGHMVEMGKILSIVEFVNSQK